MTTTIRTKPGRVGESGYHDDMKGIKAWMKEASKNPRLAAGPLRRFRAARNWRAK